MPTNAFKKDRKRGKARKSTNQDHVSKFAGDAYSLASRAVAGVNAIRKLINIETKFVDFISIGSVTSTPTVVYLTALPQGTDVSFRVGDSIRLQGLQYTLFASGDPTNTISVYVRVLLVRDNANNGAFPATTDVLSSQLRSAFPNWLNKDRFNILMDEVAVFQLPAGPPTEVRRGSISLNGHVKYRGTTNGVASAAEGSIFLMAFSASTVLPPQLTFEFRMKFTDD